MIEFIHRLCFFIICENSMFVELSITSAVMYCLSRDRSDTDICGVNGFGENEKHLISFLQRRKKDWEMGFLMKVSQGDQIGSRGCWKM